MCIRDRYNEIKVYLHALMKRPPWDRERCSTQDTHGTQTQRMAYHMPVIPNTGYPIQEYQTPFSNPWWASSKRPKNCLTPSSQSQHTSLAPLSTPGDWQNQAACQNDCVLAKNEHRHQNLPPKMWSMCKIILTFKRSHWLVTRHPHYHGNILVLTYLSGTKAVFS